MDREALFIAKIRDSSVSYGLGDDGVKLGDYIYAMDLFCENVHFLRAHFSYEMIAKKAFLVNISDILAMGAMPQYALLGVSFAQDMSAQNIVEFANGAIDMCQKWGIKIIGGDTIKGDSLNVAITLFGKCAGRVITRGGFRENDIIFHTGTLGGVAKDMKTLYGGHPIVKTSKFYAPRLRAEFIADILPFVRGGMDVSDGLWYELNRISVANNVRFQMARRFPKSVATSGEEYEMLFSIALKDERRARIIAKKHRIRIVKVAKMIRGRVRFHCKAHHG